MLSKLSLVWHLRRGLWRYWEIFYHVTFYKTRDLGHVPGADHCNSVARSPQDTMFVTPAKRKGDDLGESSNKKVKDESPSGATPYAKIQYYQVLWRAPQTKKHKTWDGDGVLVITGSRYELLDEDAKPIGSGKILGELSEGAEIKLGNRELQIERSVPASEFLSGKVFTGAASPQQANKAATPKLAGPSRYAGFVAPKFNTPRPPSMAKPIADNKGKSVERLAAQLTPLSVASKPKDPPVAGLYWTANWRRPQARKHKVWEGSGAISLIEGQLKLVNEEGHTVGIKVWKGDPPDFGDVVIVGGHEAEIDAPLSSVEYAESFKPPIVRVVSVEGSGEPGFDGAPPPDVDIAYDISPVKSKSAAGNNSVRSLTATHRPGLSAGPPPKLAIGAFKPPTMKPAETTRKRQTKKHKSWEGFGIVELGNRALKLYNDKGRLLKTTGWKSEAPLTGVTFGMDNLEVELQTPVPMEDFESKACFEPGYSPPSASTGLAPIASDSVFVTPRSFYAAPEKKDKPPGPLHDPDAEGALVLTAPSDAHQKKYNNKNLPVIPVVVDPLLAKFLRPHQREGVQFMYESVMGMRTRDQHGCILADEMFTIALVWTLLRQNPYYNSGTSSQSIIGKALIVCPVSLVNVSVRSAFSRDRLKVFVGDKDKNNIKQFMHSYVVPLTARPRLKWLPKYDDLTYCTPPIGLIVCDEGHRLKSAQAKTTKMFEALKRTPRRIILSGTPIQNDLGEFHAMAKEYSRFRRLYETPILKSRSPEASAKDIELGAARAAQLNELAKSFVLRRTADILTNYLPPKTEYVLFVQPTALQLAVFQKILRPDHVQDLVHGPTARSLALITTLTKICNSPIMLAKTEKSAAEDGRTTRTLVQEALGLLPPGAAPDDITLSGKLIALAALLKQLRQTTEEKCILVSHYTSTLNIVEAFCRNMHYTYHRLDGSTSVAKRQQLVDEFNQARQSKKFLFLLSAKAGGVGLNLIGASRLILIDSDWNPSHDLQSMARIHRWTGRVFISRLTYLDSNSVLQKRPVFIYRLITTGTIDGISARRTTSKLTTSPLALISEASTKDAGGTSKSGADSFTKRDLQDIFSVDSHTLCQTHDLLQCQCSNSDRVVSSSANSDDEAELVDPAEIARGAVASKIEKKATSTPESDSESDSEMEMGFVPASQVKPDKISKAEKKRKREALAALSEWKHVNCFADNYAELVQDPVLLHLLQETDDAMISSFIGGGRHGDSVNKDWGGLISYLFEKRSGAQIS
ncbi:DNA repair and recombination protein RAD54B [Ceratobasidium theobromae]|uniref:DNA repair and recombination protein RAD54B n=1 Tax=Ceratobasidium theobromae TaxID=1582974 RepID=A0A5N5QMS1_9AGAM|nr:DNA repair and recombination protein RAD54B [Ceratobasidium theobromae]